MRRSRTATTSGACARSRPPAPSAPGRPPDRSRWPGRQRLPSSPPRTAVRSSTRPTCSASPGRRSRARASTSCAWPPTRRSARSSGRAARSGRRPRASRSRRRWRPGTYYWSITPLDAEGHAGTPAPVSSFHWTWPSTTTPSFTDLAPAPEIVDPSFSWTAVPGAAGYEVEVNSSSDWAPGSKVCCSPLHIGSNTTTLGLSLSPVVQLDNNTYYWRVRALDANDNAGVWNIGPSFTQTFANVPPTTAPSVKNLRLRDNLADPWRRRGSRDGRISAHDGDAGARLESRARRVHVPGGRDPVPGRRVQLDAPEQRALGRDHLVHDVDATRLGLEQREAVPEPRGRLGRLAGDGRRPHVLRPRPALGSRVHHVRADLVRRLDVPPAEQRGRLHLERSVRGRDLHAVLARRARTTWSRRPA